MKRSTLFIPIALTALLGISTIDASASTTNSINLYNVKKVNNNYKVTKTSKILASKVNLFGKQHKYNGKTYYYISKLHKYTDQDGYKVVNKYYDQKTKKQSDAFVNNTKKHKTNNNSDNKSTVTTTAKIVDGYDETNQKIVDVNTFTNVLTQTAINRLNTFRQSQGLPTLTVDANLTKVAQVRAQQRALQSWSATSQEVHYDNNGTPLLIDVEKQLGMAPNDGNENAAKFDLSGLDKTIDIGNAAIDEEINEGPTGGHYQNDVARNVTKVGIGFYVDQSAGAVGYVADFQ